MAMNVGDAVVTFTGDTQNLDRAFDKVKQDANAKLGNAEQSVRNLDTSFLNAGRSGARAGDQIADTGARSRRSIEEARGAVDLLGDQFGVRIPRELKNVIAQSQLAGQALDAAFKAVAVVALISFAVDLGEKLSNLISETLIYTAEMKAADEANAKFNQTVIEHNKKMQELTKTYQDLFKTGPEKLAGEVTDLDEKLKNLNATLETQQGQLGRNAQSMTFWQKVQVAIGDNVSSLGFLANRVYGQLAEQADNARQRQENAILKTKNDIAEVEKERQIAAVNAARAAQEQTQKNADAASEAIIQAAKAFAKFQELRDLLSTPAPNILIKTTSEDLKKLGDIAAGPGSATEKIDKLTKAYQTLGLTVSDFNLAGQEASQRDAIKVLDDAGASTHDLNRAKIQLLNTEIALAKAEGKTTTELEKQRKEIQRQLPEAKKYSQTARQLADVVGESVLRMGYAYGQSSITIGQALRQIAAAEISAIASIAEKKGAEQLAEAFGSWPDFAAMAHHFASATLWFGLAGGISAAAGATAGGGGAPGSATNPVFTQDAGPVGQPQQPANDPKQIQRFATGGLISRPTLALVGDSRSGGRAREGVLPLDDPDAMEAIAGAIADRIGGDGGPRIVNHINVRSMTTTRATAELAKNLTKMVDSGRARLKSTDSRKLTRRG